jgi:hypothetical protein
MAIKYVLDAHPLIWYLEGNPRLSATAKSLIDDPSNVEGPRRGGDLSSHIRQEALKLALVLL